MRSLYCELFHALFCSNAFCLMCWSAIIAVYFCSDVFVCFAICIVVWCATGFFLFVFGGCQRPRPQYWMYAWNVMPLSMLHVCLCLLWSYCFTYVYSIWTLLLATTAQTHTQAFEAVYACSWSHVCYAWATRRVGRQPYTYTLTANTHSHIRAHMDITVSVASVSVSLDALHDPFKCAHGTVWMRFRNDAVV